MSYRSSDDSAIIGLITNDNDAEYRGLTLCELVSEEPSSPQHQEDQGDAGGDLPILLYSTCSSEHQERDIERIDSYKYLGFDLNNKLDWTHNKDTLYRRGQSCLYRRVSESEGHS